MKKKKDIKILKNKNRNSKKKIRKSKIKVKKNKKIIKKRNSIIDIKENKEIKNTQIKYKFTKIFKGFVRKKKKQEKEEKEKKEKIIFISKIIGGIFGTIISIVLL